MSGWEKATAGKKRKVTKFSVNGLGMPLVGFGCYQLSDQEAESAVCEALKAGFRHIDSAEGYNNEAAVGRGIKASGVPREEIFVTTKLFPGYTGWGVPEKSYEDTIAACKASLANLQLDYCDLYLIHGPMAGKRIEQYKALVELRRLGLARHIGVSNYNIKHFKEIEDAGLPLPEANQLEFHPLCQQKEITEYMLAYGVVPIAYSSLATLSTWRAGDKQGGAATAHLKTEAQNVQAEISKRLGVPESKLLLRWGVERGYSVLTKSCNPARIRQNLDCFGFEIPERDMQALNALDKGEPVAWAAKESGGINPMAVDTPLAA